jgi:hypothetical protein
MSSLTGVASSRVVNTAELALAMLGRSAAPIRPARCTAYGEVDTISPWPWT